MGKKRGRPVEPMLGQLTNCNLKLDNTTRDMLAVLGKGNMSKGARHAARVAYHRYQTTPGDSRDMHPED